MSKSREAKTNGGAVMEHDDIEQRVLATLTTEGRDPIDLCFVKQGIERWDPAGYLMTSLMDDAVLSRACREYLARRGARFSTWDEVLAWAEQHEWPNLDVFRQLVKEVKQRERQT